MTEVDTGVSKAYTGQGRCEEHFALSFEVVWISDGSGKVLDSATKGVERKDVGNGVGSLVRGSQNGVCWPRCTLIVGNGSP